MQQLFSQQPPVEVGKRGTLQVRDGPVWPNLNIPIPDCERATRRNLKNILEGRFRGKRHPEGENLIQTLEVDFRCNLRTSQQRFDLRGEQEAVFGLRVK